MSDNMFEFKPAGAIFDVDDTLLNNDLPDGRNLHGISRLEAIHNLGKERGISQMVEFTFEEVVQSFETASAHNVVAATWQALRMMGLIHGAEDHSHELVVELVARKNQAYERVLQEHGRPFPAAVDFVTKMAEVTSGKVAISSGAIRRDVNVFLGASGMSSMFNEDRIVAFEDVVHSKPHPEAFQRALDSLDLSDEQKQRVVAFEDDPRGIVAAKAAGLFVCGFTSRFSADQLMNSAIPPDVVFSDYEMAYSSLSDF